VLPGARRLGRNPGGRYYNLVRSVLRAVVVVSAILLSLPGPAAAAPAAPGISVKLLDGGTFDSRDLLDGKTVLVLRFQASWCKVCAREAASFNRLAERYREHGVQTLAIHVQDTAADARRFIQQHGITYPVALDPKLRIGNRFGVTGTPYTIVVNQRGEVASRLVGASAPTRLPKVLDLLVLKTKPRGRPRRRALDGPFLR
jgi:cytochrome c biogenesis protein CcmG, thiol:disulfide interchange protein DsbE